MCFRIENIVQEIFDVDDPGIVIYNFINLSNCRSSKLMSVMSRDRLKQVFNTEIECRESTYF